MRTAPNLGKIPWGDKYALTIPCNKVIVQVHADKMTLLFVDYDPAVFDFFTTIQ